MTALGMASHVCVCRSRTDKNHQSQRHRHRRSQDLQETSHVPTPPNELPHALPLSLTLEVFPLLHNVWRRSAFSWNSPVSSNLTTQGSDVLVGESDQVRPGKAGRIGGRGRPDWSGAIQASGSYSSRPLFDLGEQDLADLGLVEAHTSAFGGLSPFGLLSDEGVQRLTGFPHRPDDTRAGGPIDHAP